MQPKVTNVRQANGLGPDGKVINVLQVTYTVGTHGPFTLTTTEQELSNGIALQRMQAFANSLSTLLVNAA